MIDVWTDVIKLCSNRCSSSYSFCPILMKLGTHVLCVNKHKTMEQIFKILILKFLANFLNFTFGQSLAQKKRNSLGQQASLVLLLLLIIIIITR